MPRVRYHCCTLWDLLIDRVKCDYFESRLFARLPDIGLSSLQKDKRRDYKVVCACACVRVRVGVHDRNWWAMV